MAFPQTVRWINEILNNLSQVRLFLVPSGGVILWHGASNAVPKGWAICDGTNGTPDLRDRFVIGAGGKYGLDATGGAASATPDVTAGTAKTGIGLANASSNGTAGSAKTGINIQNASVAITTGAAATGIGIQGTTLDMNTLPSHGHTYHTNAHLGATWWRYRNCQYGQLMGTCARRFRPRTYTLCKRGAARSRHHRSGAYAYDHDSGARSRHH